MNDKDEKKFEILPKPEKKLSGLINHLLNDERYRGKNSILVNKFITTMRDNLPEKLLYSMNYNLQNFKVKENLIFDLLMANRFVNGNSCFIAGYFPHYNHVSVLSSENIKKLQLMYTKENKKRLQILIDDKHDQNEFVIFHELLHMASTNTIDQNEYYSGFSQTCNFKTIARSLTEGYTEVLVEKFFYDRANRSSYNFYYKCASLIEKVVGENKMIELYFENDLKQLCDILSIYTSDKSTEKFLYNLDNRNYEKVLEYMTILLKSKNVHDLKNGLISIDEYIKNDDDNAISLAYLESIAFKKLKPKKNNLVRVKE